MVHAGQCVKSTECNKENSTKEKFGKYVEHFVICYRDEDGD